MLPPWLLLVDQRLNQSAGAKENNHAWRDLIKSHSDSIHTQSEGDDGHDSSDPTGKSSYHKH
jgi:hypothetical protein